MQDLWNTSNPSNENFLTGATFPTEAGQKNAIAFIDIAELQPLPNTSSEARLLTGTVQPETNLAPSQRINPEIAQPA